MKGLDELSRLGAELKTHVKFGTPLEVGMKAAGWKARVADWIACTCPDSGFAAEWAAMPSIDIGDPLGFPSTTVREHAEFNLDKHLRWLAHLPVNAQVRRLSVPEAVNAQGAEIGRREVKLAVTSRAIVDPTRIESLRAIKSSNFDLARLIRLCEELNLAFATESYLSMAMLTRAIVDHVPPIFGKMTFSEVANNYGGATLKRELKHLDTTARNIADLHLHSQIRKKEALPTITQVDSSNSLDVLLAEIVVLLSD
ncbi:hypothetical protein MUO32_22360 [Shinella sp. CPCC 101442]|uniref:hypothetical protein n=1 Tax=Shinella sp. CPCC 101442 TaxID=2932265 RepID=UPI002152BFA4|nr:hypothetical protein [Shinella sp. CPCC 101442]MCR6501786.1 hypothetical protein [Shinella sp. CPCC 101442]